MKPDCYKCKYMTPYKEIYGESIKNICSAGSTKDDEDGAEYLLEISDFDTSNCGMFEKKK